MTDDERRAGTAWHEAAHAVAAVALGVPVVVVSLRHGKRFDGVTILGLPPPDLGREEREHRIVVILAGAIGTALAEPLTGRPKPRPRTARVAVESLQRTSPVAFERLTEAEGDDDSDGGDDVAAHRRSEALCDFNEWLAAAHLQYLHRWALKTVEDHRHALRKVADELYSRTVVDGAEIEAIVRGFRCLCHRGWGAPPLALVAETAPGKDPKMASLTRKSKPAVYVATVTGVTELDGQDVVVTAGVTRIRTGHPLLKVVPSLFEIDKTGGPLVEPRYSPRYVPSVDPTRPRSAPVKREDTVVATRSFIAAQGPGGMWVVQAGDRFHKDHPNVRAHPDAFRPAQAERDGGTDAA